MDGRMTSRGTIHRTVRIDDELWAQVQAQAEAENIKVSALIRQLLRGWLNQHDDKGEK